MKVAAIVAATAVAAFPVAECITLNQKRDAAPRVMGMDIQKRSYRDPVKISNDRFRKRQAQSVTETLDNEGTFYFANVSLGTPPQRLKLTIDTGSSDLWTNAPNSTLCTRRASDCADSGTYNADDSSSYNFVNSDFNISYADGSGASGDYLTDTLAIGGQTLDNFQFGVGYESSSGQGVLGVGYGINEVFVQTAGQTPYDNLPLALTRAGLTAAPAYSLWLNDLDSSTGQILFGGVNRDKFHGELQSLPILPEQGLYAEFFITLTGVSYTSSSSGSPRSISADLPTAVLLDSGSSLTYLPNDLTQQIYDAVGAQYDQQSGEAYVPCSLAGSGASMNFTFSSPSIQVAFDELLFAVTDERGNQLTFNNGEPACVFGISPGGGSTSVLGDTFLRSAYVVYDLGNNEISLAQTNFNSTTNDIVEISSGTAGVPGATPVTNAVTTAAAQTGGAINPGSDSTATDIGTITAVATATSSAGAIPAIARPTGQAAFGYIAAGAALVAAAL